MARRQQCSGCLQYLLVPPEVQTIRCAACGTVANTSNTPAPSNARARWGQARELLVPGQIRSYPGSGTHAFPSVYGPHQQQPLPRPALSPVSVHGRKRALICGLNYVGKYYSLKGSINDAKCMRYLLVEKLGFPLDSVLMLTDDQQDPLLKPTKRNMRKGMRWLVYGCQPGDSLLFYFSGHGSQQEDYNSDELNGYDEALLPIDHETEGVIIDDEINEIIVRPLPRGAKLHAIIDACHSGTVLDLPFDCKMKKEGHYIWDDKRNPKFNKGTSGGVAFCFSACDDDQRASDTNVFSETKTNTGAMTFCFIQAVENEPDLTYGRLLIAIRKAILQVKACLRKTGTIKNLVNKVLQKSSIQEPQLSSSYPFNIYSKRFLL
ncbi:hypothetical protein F3Y22_tig00112343pilonHSYRG00045 [Hibiscus syriacus]|uniref:Peptidase C14 caspase domain-containing protein n=2 Tax=Hibiscus syriacus TaxID=106335 RepID=A0A6A2XZU5_HIBSY|nr:hypothetical protein F3Y22_tig00112343pilonHSYRG00045 [Hibiscus syriacus]